MAGIALLAVPGVATASRVQSDQAEAACSLPDQRSGFPCAAQFTLRGTNGYRVTVSGEPGGPEHKAVTILVERPGQSATYTGDGTVTANSIDAHFRHFGRIAVHFHAKEIRRVRVRGNCLSDSRVSAKARFGTFTGLIRFRGEGGYTEVSTRHVHGGTGDPRAIRPYPECGPYSALSGVGLLAVAEDGPIFSVGPEGFMTRTGPLSVPNPQSYVFRAIDVEKSNGIVIARDAIAVGQPDTFSFDDALTAATIAPPAPFSGTATFQQTARGTKNWTGSLAVSLPGKEMLPLTGPSFSADLHRWPVG
ncbi:MAG TPA: hypothetical protein VFX45_07470 [Solirubrobacterales bacterium]|nr:hypothetical protein [Solirubrobacterales bacterium]